MRIRWRVGLVLLAAAGASAALWIGRDLHRAYTRLEGASSVVATPLGDVEYARGGRGPPVLVIHGSGGGFDQGALIAEALLGEGFDWIAPSRFGYLRSALPRQASFDLQADAYAHLLDRLGLARVAVVAMSHGGPSALLFALRHPQRVASLTLVSCGVAPGDGAAQQQASRHGDALAAIFRHDSVYWAASHLARRWLMAQMGADAAVAAALDPRQLALVERVIDGMNPVAPRAAGVAFDHVAVLPGERIAAISAPTLVLHARDDRLQVFRNAEFAAARIRGARLVAFDRGGHLLIAVEQPRLADEVARFILASAPAVSAPQAADRPGGR